VCSGLQPCLDSFDVFLHPHPPHVTCTARKYLDDLREAAGGDDDGEFDAAAGDEEVAEKLRLDALEVSWVDLGSSSSRLCGCLKCFCWWSRGGCRGSLGPEG
jgi:hypothetical protein